MNSRKTIGCGATHGEGYGPAISKNGINCRADILSVMREIAHAHDPPDERIKTLPRCRSCGMRIVWGKSLKKEKAIPLDPKILHIITAAGEHVSGRESHFVSCPNAEGHRK